MDAKSFEGDLKSLGFTASLAKPEMGTEAGRRRTRSKDDRVKSVGVNCRGDRGASDRRSGIGKDERQPEMARLAAR